MQAKPRRLATRTTAIIVIVIVALVVASSGGVYYYVNYVARPPCASATSGNIKVGFTISLTGTYNVEGGKSLAGIQAAASWINDNGGVTVNGKARNITLDYYDDQSSSTLVPQLYTKIITQDCAQFLLAPYSSALTGAAAPLAEQYNRVMLSHGGPCGGSQLRNEPRSTRCLQRKVLGHHARPVDAAYRGQCDGSCGPAWGRPLRRRT